MRYFLICVAAFMLLAVPAMAANVDVTFDVTKVNYCTVSDGAMTFTIDGTDYTNGYSQPDSNEYQTVTVKSNTDWNLDYYWTAPTGMPSGWVLYYDDASFTSGGTAFPTSTGTNYYGSDQSPTNQTDIVFYFLITGLELEDDWVGTHTDGDLIFTYIDESI